MMKTKILLIEDDLNITENIEEVLTFEGYDVTVVNDGDSGIKTAISLLPDLIICDISIPNKDGYEVLSVLSKNESTAKIPFIFLTAKADKDDLRKGMQLGADDYIFKPFKIDDLLNSIETRLKKKEILSKVEINNKLNVNDKIPVKFGNSVVFLNVNEIKFIKAESPYTFLKCIHGKHTLVRETINNWEHKLPSNLFLRISKSTIINVEQINSMEKLSTNSFLVKLKNEHEPFIISRRYYYKLKDFIVK